MKRFAVAVVAAGLAGACAQLMPVSLTPDMARAELIALDDAWLAAEVRRDRAALEQILDEAFLATLRSGQTVDRAEYIDVLFDGPIEPFTVIHDRIEVSGDVAVVVDLLPNRKVKFVWVAVRREGKWRVIARTTSGVTGN